MKKLLVLALATNVAMAENAFVADMRDLGSDIGGQIAEIVTIPVEAIKDVSTRLATNVKDASKKAVTKVKDVGQALKDSEFAQDFTDVASQFAAFPGERYEVTKDAFNVSVDATKTVGRKIADSRFVARAKDANQVIIDTTKKAATKVKDVAYDVVHSEAVEDAGDVLSQFASAPREAWITFAALFKASEEKIA